MVPGMCCDHHLFVQGHDIVRGLALLALAGGHKELVAHVQVEAVARVQPGGAPRAHYEALQRARAGARLRQERPASHPLKLLMLRRKPQGCMQTP